MAELILIYIPQANRKQRPIYIRGNPLTGTYRRNREGAYHCSEETVKQMLGEQMHDARDSLILEGFGLKDLHRSTLQLYRRHFANRQPQYPFNDYDDLEFLRKIGGWSRDRQSGTEGLNLAGILMFGKLRSILDALPNYIVDYQERSRSVRESRWIDRLTTDFTWSGNLHDFYRNVIGKLYADLKVPFRLKGDERIEDTPVHEALREAFVNTLIHADYSGRCSILVVKRPDLFGFRNPGLLRIPREEALRGGTSDCRNRNLQKMFQLIGQGEQARSGFPKIYKNWDSQQWWRPELEERIESDQVLLALRMSNLLPDDVLADLDQQFGATFEACSPLERLALVTAKAEGCITHRRLLELTREHPADLTSALHDLVERDLLEQDGRGKGTFYFLPGEHPIQDALFGAPPELPLNSEHLPEDSEQWRNLKNLAQPVSATGKAPREAVEAILLQLCREQCLNLEQLARLLSRKRDSLRNNYINPMVDRGLLDPKHPNIRNHPKQKYRTV